jgi:hypothetical protein
MQEATANRLVVPAPASRDVLTGILREGTQRRLADAIDAEVASIDESRQHRTDET